MDGAHNPAAARCLRETLERCFPGKRLILVMGVFKDKDYRNIAAIMAPLAASVHTVTLPDASRSLPGQTLALVMREYCSENVPVQAEPSIDAAVRGCPAGSRRGRTSLLPLVRSLILARLPNL